MKRVIILLFLSFSAAQLSPQGVRGRILDENREAMPYANVMVIAKAESAFITGATTQEDGTFSFPMSYQNELLKISSVGYENRYIPLNLQANLGDITMQPSYQALGDVVIKGNLPTYKLTPEGFQTSVAGTVLGKMGTAEDVLPKIPSLTKTRNGFEIFGKGKPQIYINGRKMREDSELDELSSESIKNIEVITNPGVKYDTSVKCVVKITTLHQAAEGWGYNLRAAYFQSENTDCLGQLNRNYRHRKLDLFGTCYYFLDNGHYPSISDITIQADTLWQQHYTQNFTPKKHTFRNIVGMNYAIDNQQSIGWKYTLTLRPPLRTQYVLHNDIRANGEIYDLVENDASSATHYNPYHLLSAYYTGHIGNTEIDFNADYLFNKQRMETAKPNVTMITSAYFVLSQHHCPCWKKNISPPSWNLPSSSLQAFFCGLMLRVGQFQVL